MKKIFEAKASWYKDASSGLEVETGAGSCLVDMEESQ